LSEIVKLQQRKDGVFSLSIPQDVVNKRKWVKGDHIEVIEKGDKLLLKKVNKEED